MLLRTFGLVDYDALIHIWTNCGPGVAVGPSDTREALALKLSRDPDLALAAEVDGQLVGTVMGGFDGRRGVVHHLAVLPEYRGQGIARALLAELEQRLAAKGCLKAWALLTAENAAVAAFYEAAGWYDMRVVGMGKELG